MRVQVSFSGSCFCRAGHQVRILGQELRHVKTRARCYSMRRPSDTSRRIRSNDFTATIAIYEMLLYSVKRSLLSKISKDRHLDITPEAATGRVNSATHLLCRRIDIGNVNRRHLCGEIE